MRYLYKIYIPYDGFSPRQIPTRMTQGRYLKLVWLKYLDSVNVGDEVWVYFHGRRWTPAVYAKGFIHSIDRAEGSVQLRVREHDESTPLTDAEASARITQAVSIRFRQVFVWPEEWNIVPACEAAACENRLCEHCETWNSLAVIDPAHLRGFAPPGVSAMAPAFWIIPARCYVILQGRQVAIWARRATHIFSAFKIGEKRYAYPLALGMYRALARREKLAFDAIVPIPLSPDKIDAGELHRTRTLATELERLLDVKVRDYLSLAEPISKRKMIADGSTTAQFRERYRTLLQVDDGIKGLHRILLVDDVVTHGTTISTTVSRLREANPELDVVVASAGQMIIRNRVANETGFIQ